VCHTQGIHKGTEDKSNKQLYEQDINPVFRCLEENYLGKETPKLNVMFFDIEVDFDPDRGYSTTDDPFMPITAISCYMGWTDQLVTLAVPPKTISMSDAKVLTERFPQHHAVREGEGHAGRFPTVGGGR
jgi:DNA polymerase elongation subunit (family B)